MPLYENVFIARQDISGAQVDTLADTFTQLVADNGGEVKKREYWGLRNLAYRMRKNRKGHYVLLNIDSPSAAIAELERTMRINEDVIRYLTIRVDELEEGPRWSWKAAANLKNAHGASIGRDLVTGVRWSGLPRSARSLSRRPPSTRSPSTRSPSSRSQKRRRRKWKANRPAARGV